MTCAAMAVWSFLKRPAAQPVEAIGNVLGALFTSDEERLDKQAMLARIAQHALEIGRTTIVLEWPVALIAVPATLFCLLASIVNILWLYRRLR